MLLRFFRINDPYRLLGLLAFMILISLLFMIHPAGVTVPDLKNLSLGEAISRGKLMYIEVIDFTAPMATGMFGAVDWLFGRSVVARQIIALILLFLQASFFGILLINNKAYTDSTYVPSLIFAILCFFSFDMFSFSPELLGSTVLLIALNYLFKEVEFRHERDGIVLNLGVCLGAATLLVFSYLVFFFATVIILFTYTRPNLRKVLLLLFGFLLPHLLLITLYYLWGETNSLWKEFYQANFTFQGSIWMNFESIILLSAIPLIYFVLSLFMLNREARFTKYQSQLFQVMFLWMLAALGQILVTRTFSPDSLIIFIPSLTYFISHFLLLVRRKWLGETMLWIFLTGVIGISMLARFGKLDSIRYDLLVQKPPTNAEIKKKRIMVASGDTGFYLENTLGGYFLDWNLSREILEHPDYYENVLLVNNSLESDTPEVIFDPNDLMKAFFLKIPQQSQKYRRDGDFYMKINRP